MMRRSKVNIQVKYGTICTIAFTNVRHVCHREDIRLLLKEKDIQPNGSRCSFLWLQNLTASRRGCSPGTRIQAPGLENHCRSPICKWKEQYRDASTRVGGWCTQDTIEVIHGQTIFRASDYHLPFCAFRTFWSKQKSNTLARL